MKKLVLLAGLLFLLLPLNAQAQDATPEATPDASQAVSAGVATPEATPQPFEELVSMFSYDQSTPLNVRVISTKEQDGATVEDITYDRLGGGDPAQAYLVLPKGDGPFAAILYVHWYEPSSPTSNRAEFLNEAVDMAKDGAVSLLISTNWSDPAWFNDGRSLATDYDDSIAQVRELRRALDVLEAQPQVDKTRIGYVGHDFGAMYGAVLSGVDARPKAYVLIAGTKSFSDWFLLGSRLTDTEQNAFIDRMSALDPRTYVAHATAAYILFQFGEQDPYVSHDDASDFFHATAVTKGIMRYDTGHAMELPEIEAARKGVLDWQLGLGSYAAK
jgi:dienelactone hydrolase